MKFFFIFLSFSRFFLKDSSKIINYWDNGDSIGFYDSKGSLYNFHNNTISHITSFNPFIKNYKYISNHSCIDFISKSKISSIIENKKEKVQFFWNDTTLYQTILYDDTFFRINYFGKYLLFKNNVIYENYLKNFKKNEYLQFSSSFHNFLLTINNYNELSIYHYKNNDLKKCFSHFLFYQDIIKIVRIQKLHNYIYLNILYRDNSYKSITLFHDESNNKFRYLHQNNIIVRDKVIDFYLKYPNVYILTESNIQCYLLKTFDNFSQLIFKRQMNHQYDSIYYFNDKLYLSGEKYLDFFIIKKN